MIRNIVFDFGNVLVHYDFKLFIKSIFKDDAAGMEEFFSTICTEENVLRYDKGDQPFEEIVDEWKIQYPQWKDQLDEFCYRHIDVVLGEEPGMRGLITELKSQGYRVYGLTNWSNVIYQVLAKFDILHMMDGRVISSEEKLVKPYPEIYNLLLQRYNLKAEECVFIDDKARNVAGAINVGMSAIQFHDAAQLRKDLEVILK